MTPNTTTKLIPKTNSQACLLNLDLDLDLDLNLDLDIQRACEFSPTLSNENLETLAKLAISSQRFQKNIQNIPISLTIRLTTPEEIQALNLEFRGKDKPTNVLSFPFEMPEEISLPEFILGDIAICPEIVMNEAIEQKKNYPDHFAHMVIHGVLHLLGHDHEEEEEAMVMESLEIELLEKIQIRNPYQELDRE
jgi:probable rRNA maturation factor